MPIWDDDGNKSTEKVKGLIIIAHSIDSVTIYTGALSFGGAALSGELSASSLENITKAYITGSKINKEEDWGRRVIIRAHQDTGLVIYTGAAARGGSAIAGAFNTIDLAHITQAYIDNSTVYALEGIEARASTIYHPLENEQPGLIIGGLAGGSSAIAGVVSLVMMGNTNEAFVKGSTLYSRSYITIKSIHNVKIYNITASAGAGVVGGGGSIFLTSLENTVRAFVEESDLNASGALEVIAKSRDDIEIIVATGGVGLGAGAAGAVGLTLIETETEAYVQGNINQHPDFKPGGKYEPNDGQTVLVLADNKTIVNTVGGALGAGLGLGVGAVMDLVSIQNRTLAVVKEKSKIYAHGDVTIKSLSEKDIDVKVYSVGGGLFGLSGAVSIIIVGSPISEDAEAEFTDALLDQLANDLSLEKLLHYTNEDGEELSRLPGHMGDRVTKLISVFDITKLYRIGPFHRLPTEATGLQKLRWKRLVAKAPG